MEEGKQLTGNFFVHHAGICESGSIGDRTRIWAFSHILQGAIIGEDCNICESVFIENDVIVGDRVTIKNGVQLWDGLRVESDVFIGPNVTFTNDRYPRSRMWKKPLTTTIQRGASIGANATILPGLIVGTGSMVGAGSVVTRDVPPNAIVAGNPARIMGYQGTAQDGSVDNDVNATTVDKLPGNAKLLKFAQAVDMRGSLVAVEFTRDLPFIPQRFFVVYQVPSVEVRGEHAHRICEQILVPLQGAVRVLVDDGNSREEIVLSDPSTGLYMPALTWGTQYQYTADAVLGVFASHPYDDGDYIRKYEEFVLLANQRQAT